MIDRFGKVILSMVALLVFQAYLYVSEPPTSDVYFILITIVASLLGLIFNLALNHNITHLYKNIRKVFIKKDIFKANNNRNIVDVPIKYSVLTISLTSFIVINMVFALIYM